jgi:ribonuclease R
VTTPPERSDIRRDVIRLLENEAPDAFRPRQLAERLGYESERAYGRFRDVIDQLEEDELVARLGLRYVSRPGASAREPGLSASAPSTGAQSNGHSPAPTGDGASGTTSPSSPSPSNTAPSKEPAAAAPQQNAGGASPSGKTQAEQEVPEPTAQQKEAQTVEPARGVSPLPTSAPTHEQPKDQNKAIGRLIAKSQGYGFVEVEGQDEDYFIRENNMGTALSGDVILVGLGAIKKGDNKRRECEVIEVVERKRTQVVGTFRDKGHFAFVDPDDTRITQDIFISHQDFADATDGDKVVASIDKFEDRKASPEGRVLRVLGPGTDPATRVLSLAMSMDVKADFPEEVEAEAETISVDIPQDELARRRDLRDEKIFTIDPEDAKDFDDAIHIERRDDGTYEVGVHIADPSFYVQPGSALDTEALERATSVYLVDRTIPMLPEKLSNKVCSLRPGEDKLAFSCIMQIDAHGDVESYELAETVIHSKERLTYDEAQDYIDGGFPDDPVAREVVTANRLAKTLTKKRMREGSVDFDTDEVKVLLGPEGHPADIVRRERIDANRLIEELMLLANRTVARHIAEQNQQSGPERPFIYRIHPEPDAERIQSLAEYVQVFGYELELTDGNARSTELNRLLSTVRGTPEEPVIKRAALQSMSKAVYQSENTGHYGLGFPYYTHFTSPIRRYPDLLVHRLLKHYARVGSPAEKGDLDARLKHCSGKEREAQEAERESVKLKQVEYAQAHVGEEFDGVITGVTKFGVFIELTDLLVEGLVHVSEMSDDYYEYDEGTFTMTGEKTGKTYRPGGTVRVQLAAANPEKREIDLLFV